MYCLQARPCPETLQAGIMKGSIPQIILTSVASPNMLNAKKNDPVNKELE